MSCITFQLLLTLLGCSNALKIAVGDQSIAGTGSGSGSGSGKQPKEVQKSKTEIVKTDVEIETGGNKVKFPKSVIAEIVALAPAGTVDIKFKLDPGMQGGGLTVAASACDPTDVTAYAVDGGGTETKIDVTALTTGTIDVDLTGCSGGKTCVSWDETASEWTSLGASGTPPTCKYKRLSAKSGLGGFGGASGDPKATNLAGQNFEILAMGTFQLLSISQASSLEMQTRLTLDATIDRAGEMCGATYIKNVSMTGSWIQQYDGLSSVRVQAASDVPKHRALQVAMGSEEWEDSKNVGGRSIIKKASAKELVFLIHGVTIETKIDAHRVRKSGVKTNKFANFLNVNVNGLKEAQNEGVRLGGLLAYDDHAFAEQTPDNCKAGKLPNLKQKLDDDTDVQMKFLSSMQVQ